MADVQSDLGVGDRKAPPSALVIFGASGDLTRRKLVPGLANLARHKRLPDEFAVVGVGRSDFDDEAFRRQSFGPIKHLFRREEIALAAYRKAAADRARLEHRWHAVRAASNTNATS